MKLFKKLLPVLAILFLVLAIVYLTKKKPATTTLRPLENNFSKFVVFSDIHSNYKNLEKALIFAHNGQVEFIVITGDLTTMGNKSELLKVKNILDESGLKYYAIPGNHDLWFSRQIKVSVWQEVFGADYQAFTSQGQKFILINNGEDYTGMSDEQWPWLTNELKDCPQITCLVFMHEPLNHPSSTHIMGEQEAFIASQAANLAKMLVDSQIKEVFAGHLHFSNTYEIDGIKTTIVGAISDYRNLQLPRFLVAEGEDRKEQVISD